MNRNDINKIQKYNERLNGGRMVIHDPAGRPLEWYIWKGIKISWEDAMVFAEDLTIGGGGWRLPTLEELKGLYRPGGKNNLDPGFMPGEDLNHDVWSCESKDHWAAYFFDFSDGNAYPGTKGHAMHRITSSNSSIPLPTATAAWDVCGRA